MLTKCDWTNAETAATYSLNSDVAPLKDFDVTVNERTNTDRTKAESHGVNPTFSYRGGMTIHCEGDLFKDTSADYVAERKLLVAALFGDPNSVPVPTQRKLGTLAVGFEGETEDWLADCIVLEFSGPVQALYPAFTNYLVSFFSWNPWFVGSVSGNKHYWS